jgi:LAS superfamily LD-carboxypeptidase LdcB
MNRFGYLILLFFSTAVKAQPFFTDCFYCGIDLGSDHANRQVTELTVVGKPKNEGLAADYEPENLIDVKPELMTPLYRQDILKSGINEKMRSDAYYGISNLLAKAHAEKIDLFIHSAYRSYEIQCKVFVSKLKKEIILSSLDSNKAEDVQRAVFNVNTRSALPGQSEHQLGTVVDLVTFLPQYENADKKYSGYNLAYEMQSTQAYLWLSKNADQFGFALSYPYSDISGYEQAHPKTGYIYEPWHWRFIGVKHALAFKKCGAMVLREYLQKIEINPEFKCIQSKASIKLTVRN